jgi:hypothetical protein
LDYGECYLNYSYSKFVTLNNETDYSGKYELQTQEESAKGVYSYHSDESCGIIPPHSCRIIPVIVEIKRLGQVNFPIFIKIIGSDEQPHAIDISAVGIGPSVILSSTDINFGKIPVLKETTSILTLSNESPIVAHFTAFTTSDHSVFTVEPNSGVIAAKSTASLTVTAYLDDCLKFGDVMRVGIKSGGVQEVSLQARGFGSTITFPESLRAVSFGDFFSNRPCSQVFTLTNKGRRNQYVQWAPEDKRHGNKGATERETEPPIFTVTPNRFLLRPGMQQDIVFKGCSTKAQKVREVLVCQAAIEKDPSRKPILDTTITANFINPLIEVSPQCLTFLSIHQKDDDFSILSQTLVVTNTSSLPLTMQFKCPSPYRILLTNSERVLQPTETVHVVVEFDPSVYSDRISCKQQAKLLISYAEHPQKDSVDLISEVSFPNLTLATTSIDFGCIPNHTELRRTFTMSNSSSLTVHYSWLFITNDKSPDPTLQNRYVGNAFDILPIRGSIPPNGSQTSQVVFYGHENKKTAVTALCDVLGGPKYEIQLYGEASSVQYEFDRDHIDFGLQSYQDIHEQDLMLANTGRVSFDYYTILFPKSQISECVAILPAFGTIAPGGKQKITLKFCPCGPEAVHSEIYFQIASFEPVRIPVTGAGTFPRILLSLPRIHDEVYHQFMHLREKPKEKPKNSLLQEILGENAKAQRELSPVKINPHELDLRVLERKTHDFLTKLNSDIKGKYQVQPKQRAIGSTVILYKSQQPARVKSQPSGITELSQVVLCKYLCDFGNVVRNTSRKKLINVTNKGATGVSFTLDKGVLGGSGFTVEPEKVKNLPGEPFCESVELQVSFQTRSLDLGPSEVELPIHIYGGPTIVISLKAFVTLPDLTISHDDIDFEDVLCGQRKSVTVQFYNPNVVPCEWFTNVGEAGSATKKKKNQIQEFEVVPSSATLPPGEKMNVMMRFSPSEQKDYDEEFLIKLVMNSKTIPLRMRGRGVKLSISFEPDNITLPPILPHSEGTEAKLYVVNPTNFPLEIYSTDFDGQYLEEESIIRKLNWCDEPAIFIPPRLPGDPLPDYIIESVSQKTDIDSGLEELSSMQSVGDLIPETPSRKSPPKTAEESQLEQFLNLVVIGPPLAGKTTQAKQLAAHYNSTYLRIDDVVEEFMENKSNTVGELSARLKEALSNHNERKGKDSQGHHFSNQAVDPDTSAVSLSEVPHEADHSIPYELLCEVLSLKIHSKECKNGIVVDSLESKYFFDPPKILKGIIQALGEKKKCVLINLALEPSHIRQRELLLHKAAEERQADILHAVKEVTEEEYDLMTDAEKKTFHQTLLKYKKKLKDLQNKRAIERRIWESEASAKAGEKKEEEKTPRKKDKNTRRGTKMVGMDKGDKHAGGTKEGKQGPKASTASEKNKDTSRKVDKPEKERTEELKKAERLEARSQDEAGSHQELVDATELMLGEQTYKVYDLYTSTYDSVIAVIKDFEKGPAPAVTVSTPDKKMDKTRAKVAAPVHVSTDATTNPPPGIPGEFDMAPEEINFVSAQEVFAAQDPGFVFSSILSLLPPLPVIKTPEDKNELHIPEPFIEQIVYYPQPRETIAQTQQNFTLSSKSAEEEQQLAAQELTRALSFTGLATISAKPEVAKRSKHAAKMQVEELKPVETEEEPEKESFSKYRWVLQPKEKKEFIVKFTSTDIGKFEKGLNFEITGSKGKYTFRCTGVCEYAQIVKDFRKVFPKWRKSKEDQVIIHGEYVANTGVYEFGPLLYSKPREKYMEKFPENRLILKITNPTQQIVKLQFTLHHDVRGDCFFLEPSSMELKYNQSLDLNLWAYPRSPTFFEDTLVCLVKDNPEPILFKVSCIGVKPELEIDKKTFSFDKLLLHRVETREIKIKNNLYMPVGWKLIGVDALGEEFKIAPLDGILEPFKECTIVAKFCGTKPLVIKRIIRLEVFDIEKIGGVVQSETILIQAEAYDVSMEVHCPKGSDGTLDFGVLKVYEEAKQVCVIKNKGKYEIGYRFVFDSKDVAEHFSITPIQGVIQPSDKPFPIQVIFRSTKEIQLKDYACLKCLTVEPSTAEVIDSVPIKLTTRAVFSKYAILPVRDLNFGALVYGSKGVRQFYIDNIGEFDFRFSVYKIIQGTNDKVGNIKRTGTRQAKGGKANSPPPAKVNKKELVKQADAANFGPFVVYPTSGVVLASTRQSITVEFHPEHPGSYEEVVALDISDRSPSEIDVIEYKLLGESCVPGISNTDYNSIFEEHTVCKRLDLFSTQSQVFSEEDKVFYFGAYLVGHQIQSRFKISNPFKVPCEVTVACKPRSKSSKGDSFDMAFDVEPKKLTIPSHEYSYAAVTFHPTLMQSYNGMFEATVEGVNDPKFKTITFELRGEGTLPRINIERPTMRSKTGLLMLKFKRGLIGTSQVLPIILKNDGIIDAKVKLDWNSSCAGQFECSSIVGYMKVKPQEIRKIDIKCTMREARQIEGELRLSVVDNRFEDTLIQLVGEGFMEDLTIEGLKEDAFNLISLGDCFVEETKQFAFGVRNHSNEYMRVTWGEADSFTFTPNILHVKPKCTRDVVVAFHPQLKVVTANEKLPCKYCKIRYTQGIPEEEWDDHTVQVKWLPEDAADAAPKKVLEQYPEPAFEVIPNSSGEQTLTLSAFSNYSLYQCDVTNIAFKSTMMFQTRVFRFPVRNTGKVKLRYELCFANDQTPNGEPWPFIIEPAEGVIDAGDSATIAVKFSPQETGDYTANINCFIPNLSKDCKPLSIQLTGSSLRPLCHFELEESDYLTSERRNMELGNTSNVMPVTDPSTRVIEFFSCGIKVKNTRRFYVVNPTNKMYDFEWVCNSFDGGQQNFNCLSPKGTIMSGKKFDAVFEYIPEDLDLKVLLLL